jgi:hypothetical protein
MKYPISLRLATAAALACGLLMASSAIASSIGAFSHKPAASQSNGATLQTLPVSDGPTAADAAPASVSPCGR